MVSGGELRAGEGGRDQGVMRQEINFARQAGGGLEERFVGGGIEEREFGARETQAMREVGREFVAGECGHVMRRRSSGWPSSTRHSRFSASIW